MSHHTGVYRLDHVSDDPRYYGFGCRQFPEQIPENRTTRAWRVNRLAPRWKPIQVRGRVRPFNDYPCVNLAFPAFSLRAVEALREFLEPNGELLPLKTSSGSYFAYNVTTVADVLNYKRSKINWLDEPITALSIERYEFFVRKLENHTIFRISEDPTSVYVTEGFVARAAEQRLRGMDFLKVWPLPPRADWRQIARVQREARSSEGLPPGRTITGESVFIGFALKTSQAKATDAQRLKIEKIEKELDEMLVDIHSDSPDVGYPQGCDFDSAGKCRILLSCPDADALFDALQPWLIKLEWPFKVTVAKRYGPYLEPYVPEKRVNV
jgi:hypothetical protein